MDNVLFVQEYKCDKNLPYNDRSLNVEQFPILELDIREKVSSSHKVLEDVSETCQPCIEADVFTCVEADIFTCVEADMFTCVEADMFTYIELSVIYTFSRPMMLGFMIVNCAEKWSRLQRTYMFQRR